MRSEQLIAGLTATVSAASLADVCTTSYAVAALPQGALESVTIDSSSVTAVAAYNTSVTGDSMFPDSTFDYCNVTVCSSTYTHDPHLF